MLSAVYTKKRPPDPEGRLDFVRAIGEEQVKKGTVPKEVLDLRATLLDRAGL
jgi:hypothetical protein